MPADKLFNITGGLPPNPGSGNTSTGESGIAFDTGLDTIKVFDGATLTTFKTGVAQNSTLAAATTLTRADSGKIYFLNHATEFAVTLPAAEAGLEFTFIVANAPESAAYTIVTEGSCQVIVGHVLTSGFADSGSDAETTAGGTTITFVDSVAVLGDRAHLVSDGTLWYASCICAVEAGITITG